MVIQEEIKKENKLDPEKLEKELEQCRKEKDNYFAGWQRTQADFLNYKKQGAERLKKMGEYVNLDLALKILPILDNFNLAEKNLPEEMKSAKSIEGVLQIKTQILDFLKNQEIEEIKAVGEKFDPNFHEAIEEIETKDKESGMVAEEIQKGYKLDGRVIRPARVKVVK